MRGVSLPGAEENAIGGKRLVSNAIFDIGMNYIISRYAVEVKPIKGILLDLENLIGSLTLHSVSI